MELKVDVSGVHELINKLVDLRVRKVNVFVANALTGLADAVQDGLIQHTRLRLTVRGNWLVKGYKYGINRYRAGTRNLEAEVWTQAPWLVEQEELTTLRGDVGRLAVPLRFLRVGRTDPRKIPKKWLTKSLPNSQTMGPLSKKDQEKAEKLRIFKVTSKRTGAEILYARTGHGKRSTMRALYALTKETKEPKRIELVETARHYIDRQWQPAMERAIDFALRDSGLR